MQSEILFKNEYSYIQIDDDTLQVITNDTNNISARSVSVYDGVQLEIGRAMSDFKEALCKTRIPLIIREVPIPVQNIKGYQIIRMHTGKVDDKVIVNVTEKNNKINKISFNKELKNDVNYRRYNSLSAGNQLTLPAINTNNTIELSLVFQPQLMMVMSAMFKGNAIFVSANYTASEIDIIVNADEQTEKLSLLYNRKNNLYELSSISMES